MQATRQDVTATRYHIQLDSGELALLRVVAEIALGSPSIERWEEQGWRVRDFARQLHALKHERIEEAA